MKILKILNLTKGCVISIVGAGGKTTFMFNLAEELRRENRVMVTTTTKIFKPHKEQYDFINIEDDSSNTIDDINNNGIYVYGEYVNKDNKIVGLNNDKLDKYVPYFDYTIIEADGSKRKSIKGWNECEPVIYKKTNKTVGILSIDGIGKKINESNVHRVEEFMNITNSKMNECITIENMKSIVFHNKGLFKNSIGEKVLFINKVDGEDSYILAQKLLKSIIEENHGFLNKIIIGSLRNKNYNLVYEL